MTTTARVAKSQKRLTDMTPAQRMAHALRPNSAAHSFTLNRTPAKPVHVASSRFTTA